MCIYSELKKKEEGIKHCGRRKNNNLKYKLASERVTLGSKSNLKAQSGERASPAILQTGS